MGEELDGIDVAGDLEVDEAAVDADDAVLLDGTQARVGSRGAEGGGVLAPDKDVVGVGGEEGFETVAPTSDVLCHIAAASHGDDVVDEGVAPGSKVACGAEANDVIDRRSFEL